MSSKPVNDDVENGLSHDPEASGEVKPGLPEAPVRLRKSVFEQCWRRIKGNLYWLFPNWSVVSSSDRAFEKSHDQAENEETCVPEELELRVPIIWGCELYGPAEINELYAGLHKLGWGLPYRLGNNEGIAEWVKQSRAYGRQGSWLNGGRVVDRNDQQTYLGGVNRAQLPAGVVSLDLQFFQLTPSLTGVLVGFRLTDAMARQYESEINTVRTTYRRRQSNPRSIEMVGPENQKRSAVARLRVGQRHLIANWYRKHLPGFFSTLGRSNRFPMMELLCVKSGPILVEPADAVGSGYRGWRRLISSVFPGQVWTSQSLRGVQLVTGQDRDDDQGLCITLSLDESQFSEDSMSSYGGRSHDSLVHRLNDHLRYVLPHAATLEHLKEQTRYLSMNREQLKIARAGRANLKRTLRAIGQFFDQTLGVPTLARELGEKSRRTGWYQRDIPDFTAPAWSRKSKPRKLSDDFQASTHFMASRLAEEEVVMRGHYEQFSSILSVHENVRMQRRMELLTALALVVAVLSLAVALASFHSALDWLKGIAGR